MGCQDLAHIPSASPSLQHPLPAPVPPHLTSQPLGEMVKGMGCRCNANPQHLLHNRESTQLSSEQADTPGEKAAFAQPGLAAASSPPEWSGQRGLGILQAQGWANPSWEQGQGGKQHAEPVVKSSGSTWPAKVDFPLASGMGGLNGAIAGVWDATGV